MQSWDDIGPDVQRLVVLLRLRQRIPILQKKVVQDFSIEGVDSDTIMSILLYLSDLGFVEVATLSEEGRVYVYPVRLTGQGIGFIETNFRDQQENFLKFAGSIAEMLTGIKFESAIRALKSREEQINAQRFIV